MSRGAKSWGFPRWGEYGRETETVTVRTCDYQGCNERGDRPAPKSPNSPEKWWFCEEHAAQYNRNWNYFEGLSSEEAEAFAHEESRENAGYSSSGTYSWAGVPDEGGRSQVEREALAALDLDSDATDGEIKARFRELAKKYHPDRNPGDLEAEQRFQQVRAAYDALTLTRPPGAAGADG